jgi:hypothetical protein
MTPHQVHPALAAAVSLSRDVVTAADRGDLETLAQLDAQRLKLLQSFRSDVGQVAASDRLLLEEISELNDRALGLMEHHRRIKGRAFDLAAVGRRAVAAYSVNRQRR